MSGKSFKMKYTNGKKADPSSFPFNGVRAESNDSPLEAFSGEAALGGAAKGAMAGAAFGPWGAVAGGVIGGISGGISGGKKEEEAEKLKLIAQRNIQQQLDEEEMKQVEFAVNSTGQETEEGFTRGSNLG